MKSKLLLIDNLSAYIFFIKDIMVNDGFEVKVQENTSRLKNILQEFSPHIILIDIHMNKCQGFEILLKIKKRYKYSNPIIVMSSGKKVSDIEKAFDLGAYDYLIKPLNIRDLKNKIRQAITKQEFEKKDCHVSANKE